MGEGRNQKHPIKTSRKPPTQAPGTLLAYEKSQKAPYTRSLGLPDGVIPPPRAMHDPV